jgi:hypothetical protein
MARTKRTLLAAVAALAIAACADFLGSGSGAPEVPLAFQTVPAGFSASSNSFDDAGDTWEPFAPDLTSSHGSFNSSGGGGGNSGPGSDNSGSNDVDTDGDSDGDTDGDSDGDSDRNDLGRGFRGLMGGGLASHFLGGGIFSNSGPGNGPFGFKQLPSTCTFDDVSDRVTCPDKTRRGLTISSSFQFKDAAGVAQPEFIRGVTDFVNARISVTGTKTRADGTITSEVSHQSDRTVTGFAAGSTQRTVNGTASAHEEVSGTKNGVTFSVVRDAEETTTNIVIPTVDGRKAIPTSGTILRKFTVTITRGTEAPVTKTRTEELTFTTDGANVKITQDGVTKNCTIPLPKRKMVC